MALSSGAEVVWCIMMIVATLDWGGLSVSQMRWSSKGRTAWSCFLTLSSAIVAYVRCRA